MNAKDVMLARALGSGGGSGYTLPVASPTRLGGVKPEAATDEMSQPVGVDAAGKLWTELGSAVWVDDLLESGTLVADTAINYTTSITLARLREYKAWQFILKGESNTSIANLFLLLGDQHTGISLSRKGSGGQMSRYEWIDDGKSILFPFDNYNGNPSMLSLGSSSNAGANTSVSYGLGFEGTLCYIDVSGAADNECLRFYCSNVPTINYAFEIRGLIK